MSDLLHSARIAAVAVLLVLTGAVLLAAVAALVGYEAVVVSTSNMQPALGVGDLAIVTPTRVEQIAPREIIIYRTPQDPHTVLIRRMLFSEPDGLGGQKLQVRGDSEPSSEQVTVQIGNVLGQVALSVPRAGALVTFGNSVGGRALLFGLPLVMLAIDRVRGRGVRRSAAPATDAERVGALLESGQRALAAGYPELALRAADGALALDPSNVAAALLRRVGRRALDSQRERVLA